MTKHWFEFPEPEKPGLPSVWNGRIIRLMYLVSPLQQGDVQWLEIEWDIGRCTWAYVKKNEDIWRLHVARIQAKVDGGIKERIEAYPVWC
ncbi:protein of unknown function [Nitrospira japonica]|uniref:Uncharacterized protein n=1 Tax=Nitrospira japonica TaxID=1325564 RepID=A0A1W1I1A6_9BACT|nr:hypothetical protein [Nitrospira japonica]SLM46772.1 protein of unknown function [Nitrospira japonica]